MSAELPLEDPRNKPLTTQEVEQLLWNKYTDRGEYVLLFDVPNIVGLRQERRCDAVAIGMWQSTGRLIHGFEIKVSRGDWLREVKAVSKADPFIEQCDRWWLVTGDASIAKPEEIPAAWGWMTATKNGLRIQRPAQVLPQDETRIRRLWAFALIRRAAERGNVDSAEFQAALQKHRDEADRRADDRIKSELARSAPAFEQLQKRVADFEKASGMKFEDWRLGNIGKLARRLSEISEDGYRGFNRTLAEQVRALRKLADDTQAALEALGDPAVTSEDGRDD